MTVPRIAPTLELLEDRVVPAFTTSFVNGDLLIIADGANDVIDVTLDAGRILVNGRTIRGGPTLANVNDIDVYGGAGNDRITVTVPGLTIGVELYGDGGDDVLTGADGSDELDGGAGNDQLYGRLGRDDLYGRAGNDVLDGGEGNDDLFPGFAFNESDAVLGGSGEDDLFIDVGYSLTLEDGRVYGAGWTATLSSVEEANLSAFGLAFGHGLVFNAGAFTGRTDLRGSQFNDTLIGGRGEDNLRGEAGNDTLLGGRADDVLDGGAGNDDLRGEDGNDYVFDGWNAGDDVLSGGAGDDTISGGDGTDTLVEKADVSFTLTSTGMTGLGTDTLYAVERTHLTGGGGANTIDASAFAGPVTLVGLGGNDRLTGGGSADTLDGGAGDDVLDGGRGPDVLLGGDGNDTLRGGVSPAPGGKEDGDFLTGGRGDDLIDGGGGPDTLVETADVSFVLSNTRLTGLGTDTLVSIELAILTGGASANTIDASQFAGSVTLYGLGGNDRLVGGGNADTLRGGDGDDTLIGGAGRDVLHGESGNDFLDGGADWSADDLWGGPGADTLVDHYRGAWGVWYEERLMDLDLSSGDVILRL